MNKISAQFLSDDFSEASQGFDRLSMNDVEDSELLEYLKKFQAISLAPSLEVTPNLTVTSPRGDFRVENSGGELYVSDIGDPNLTNLRASPEEAVSVITGTKFETDDQPPLQAKAAKPGTFLATLGPFAILLLVAGAGATIGTLTLKDNEPLHPPVDLPLVTDAAEISELEARYSGTYTTGQRHGDRGIVLQPKGKVEFSELRQSPETGVPQFQKVTKRSYDFAQKAGHHYVVADKVHVIELRSRSEITDYGGTYQRSLKDSGIREGSK